MLTDAGQPDSRQAGAARSRTGRAIRREATRREKRPGQVRARILDAPRLHSVRTAIDVLAAASLIVVVVVLIVLALDPRSGDRAARLWARGVHDEQACPTAFGKAFWFACAGDVRRQRAGG